MKQLAAGVPMGRVAHPAEIADAVLFLASDQSSYVTGSELFAHGGEFPGEPLAIGQKITRGSGGISGRPHEGFQDGARSSCAKCRHEPLPTIAQNGGRSRGALLGGPAKYQPVWASPL